MGAANPIERTLINDEAIADFCSASFDTCYNYVWELQIFKNGADGNPLITLEVSMDGVHWDKYHTCAADYELIDDSVTFFDQAFASKKFRICVQANGTTTGNISANIFLKDK